MEYGFCMDAIQQQTHRIGCNRYDGCKHYAILITELSAGEKLNLRIYLANVDS
jgi:hypothetical protein